MRKEFIEEMCSLTQNTEVHISNFYSLNKVGSFNDTSLNS